MNLPSNFESVLNQSPCYLSLMDRNGVVLWISHANYGHEVSGFVSGPADAAILEDDRPTWWDAFRRSLHDRATVRYRIRLGIPEPPYLITLEGRTFPVVVDGPVRYVGAVCWDVTAGAPERGSLPAGLPAGAKWLSPVCEKVVAYLDAYPSRWVGSAELAAGLGEPNSHRFKGLLTNLVDRRILEARTGAGYRLASGRGGGHVGGKS